MLPFEPKGWQLNLRAAMAGEIDRLAQQPGPLAVDVWDRDRRVHDLENAVMYNVGPNRYGPFMQPGFCLRRLASPALQDIDPPLAEPTAAQYRFTVGGSELTVSQRPQSLAFTLRIPRLESVLATWRAARAALECMESPVPMIDKRLGLAVTVPDWFRSSHVKPLLDGVIAALHSCDDDMTFGCMRTWNVTEDELQRLRDWPGPLGRRTVVRLTERGAAWNPADDCIDEIALRRTTSTEDVTVSVWPLDVEPTVD